MNSEKNNLGDIFNGTKPVWLHLKNHETSLTLRIMVCNLCAKFHDPFRIPGDLIHQ